MRQVVLDTETTGMDTRDDHRLVEIGCLELIDRKPTGNNQQIYLNPERDSDEGALRVHGLSQDFLADKPLFTDIVDDFLAYLKGAELIIHNAPFDIGFLNHELRRLGRDDRIEDYCTVLDTLPLAKRTHPGQKNNLNALCRRYGVDNSKRELHGALLDAELLADVYLLMTGGQTRLFQSGSGAQGENGGIEGKRPVTGAQLRIQKAQAAELSAHASYLESIEADSTTWQ